MAAFTILFYIFILLSLSSANSLDDILLKATVHLENLERYDLNETVTRLFSAITVYNEQRTQCNPCEASNIAIDLSRAIDNLSRIPIDSMQSTPDCATLQLDAAEIGREVSFIRFDLKAMFSSNTSELSSALIGVTQHSCKQDILLYMTAIELKVNADSLRCVIDSQFNYPVYRKILWEIRSRAVLLRTICEFCNSFNYNLPVNSYWESLLRTEVHFRGFYFANSLSSGARAWTHDYVRNNYRLKNDGMMSGLEKHFEGNYEQYDLQVEAVVTYAGIDAHTHPSIETADSITVYELGRRIFIGRYRNGTTDLKEARAYFESHHQELTDILQNSPKDKFHEIAAKFANITKSPWVVAMDTRGNPFAASKNTAVIEYSAGKNHYVVVFGI